MEKQIRNIAIGLGWRDCSYLYNDQIAIALPHPLTVYTLHDADTTTSRILAMRYEQIIQPVLLQPAIIDIIAAASKRDRRERLDGVQIELTPTVWGYLNLAAMKIPAQTKDLRLKVAALLSKLHDANQRAKNLREDGQNVVATLSINDFAS